MTTYKCLDCGHIFEADDLTTMCCPECGSNNLKKAGKRMPKLPWTKIGIGVACLAVFFLLVRLCTIPPKIELTQHVYEQSGFLNISAQGITKNTLKREYKILVEDSQGRMINNMNFKADGVTVNLIIDELTAGETYYFKFMTKKGDIPEKIKWIPSNSYTRPVPPPAPIITCDKVADCKSKTYSIIVNVIEGSPTAYSIDGKKQSSNVFENIHPKSGIYKIIAIDEINNLQSEPIEIMCSSEGVKEFHITPELVQQVFNKIARREIGVGDAMAKISPSGNIQLTKPIDGINNLEDILDYARTQSIKYNVKVEISSEDCFDKIKSIILSR